jgi:hypothetical protein
MRWPSGERAVSPTALTVISPGILEQPWAMGVRTATPHSSSAQSPPRSRGLSMAWRAEQFACRSAGLVASQPRLRT